MDVLTRTEMFVTPDRVRLHMKICCTATFLTVFGSFFAVCALGGLIAGPILLVLGREKVAELDEDYKETLGQENLDEFINKVDICAALGDAVSNELCQDDGLWYSCGYYKCTEKRTCASNPGLLHCACPANVTSGEALYCEAKRKAEGMVTGSIVCFVMAPILVVMAIMYLKDCLCSDHCAACAGADCGGGDCGSC